MTTLPQSNPFATSIPDVAKKPPQLPKAIVIGAAVLLWTVAMLIGSICFAVFSLGVYLLRA